MTDQVKRYELAFDMAEGIAYPKEDPNGRLCLHVDLEALEKRCAELEKEVKRLLEFIELGSEFHE